MENKNVLFIYGVREWSKTEIIMNSKSAQLLKTKRLLILSRQYHTTPDTREAKV